MTKVNIYQDGKVWCYAAWIDGEYDSNGTLKSETEEQAASDVLSIYPGAIVTRVSDI
jgi:hypothetical protein